MFSYSSIITNFQWFYSNYNIYRAILFDDYCLQSFLAEGKVVEDTIVRYLSVLFQILFNTFQFIFLAGPRVHP